MKVPFEMLKTNIVFRYGNCTFIKQYDLINRDYGQLLDEFTI